MSSNQTVHTNNAYMSLDNYADSTNARLSAVRFDAETGTLTLKGKITKADLHYFYFPIKSQIALHVEHKRELIVEIFQSDLDFVNVKMLFELFSYVKTFKTEGVEVSVKWFISPFDIHILEVAQDFESLFQVGTENVLTRALY